MKNAATNLPASVRQRLLNLANENRQDFGMLLANAGERFLYRLSVSQRRESFVLKGALLLQLWTSEVNRSPEVFLPICWDQGSRSFEI